MSIKQPTTTAIRSILSGFTAWGLALMVMSFATSCAHDKAKYETHGTERAPGADAEIKVTPLNSGNYKVNVEAEHLPPPDRLSKGASHYVVWLDSPDEGPVRLGHLPLDGDRSAEMFATTVSKSFQVMVTAEQQENAVTPSSEVILRQSISM